MTLQRLRLRNLFYHWRGNSAVLLGVVVGTAVLTGSLLVGDSLRGSLRDHSLERVDRGDEVSLRLQQPTAVPRETLLGKKDVAVDEWPLPVGHILQDGEMGNHFSLRPGLEPPRTAFVNLDALQDRLKLKGQVNIIL